MKNTSLGRLEALKQADAILPATIKSLCFRNSDRQFSGVKIAVFDGFGSLLDDDGCFVAFSELGLKRAPEKLLGLNIDVVIGELDLHGPRGKRFTFSRVGAVRMQMEALKEKVGWRMDAQVVAFIQDGILVDIGNQIVGKVCQTELCQSPQKPAEVVSLAQIITVELLGVSHTHIDLSYRRVLESKKAAEAMALSLRTTCGGGCGRDCSTCEKLVTIQPVAIAAQT